MRILCLVFAALTFAAATPKTPDQCTKQNVEACYRQALAFDNKDQPQKALAFAKKGCDLDHAQACYFLAAETSEKEKPTALKLFEKSCKLGFTGACEGQADLLETLEPKTPREVLIGLYRKTCDGGTSNSACIRYKVLSMNPADLHNRIDGIEAFLLFEQTGGQSANLIDNREDGFTLWNTPIGEGWAKSPSRSLQAKIKVAGMEAFSPANKVQVVIRVPKGKVFVNETQNVNLDKQAAYLTYLIKDTGCEPIEISAQMVGYPKSKPVVKTIPFECGE